jgi:hypothetical protein
MGSLFGGKKTQLAEVDQTAPMANEEVYQNGQAVGSRIWDPAKNAYISAINGTPEDQAIRSSAQGGIQGIMSRLGGYNDPASVQKYVQAYKAPQITALNESYNKAKGDLANSAAASGMASSAGYGAFLTSQIEKNKAQGLADIEANATLYGLDAPSKMMQPDLAAYNLYNSALTGANANAMDLYEPALQGSTSATGARVNLQQLMQQRSQNQASMNQQRSGGSGILGRILGF